MGQVLDGSARTTEAIRRAIPPSEESLRALAKRYGINQKTLAKGKTRVSVADQRAGPKAPHARVRSSDDEAIVVAFRRRTLLPVDGCLYALQATIPHLTRSSLDRCLQRHGIARLAEVEGDKPARRTFKSYPIGFFHIDIADVRPQEGKLCMLTFELSGDPLFVGTVHDIVGPYLSPPNRALVLSVGEKSQIQALDREQPVLPMMPGNPSAGPTPMSAMARHHCSPRSMSPPAS